MAQSNNNLNAVFTDVANAIRNKTGKSDLIVPRNFADEIEDLGIKFNNFHCGLTAPEDNTKIWVKKDIPNGLTGVKTTVEEVTAYEVKGNTSYNEWHSSVKVGSKLYSFGMKSYYAGINGTKIHVYDLETNQKTALQTTLPNKVTIINGCAVGTKIYLFGGAMTYNATSVYNSIHVFDTENNTLETLQNVSLSSPLYEIGVCAVGTKIYLFGGKSSSAMVNTIQVFDTTNNTIETLATTLPNNMSGIACESIGTSIYLFGGGDGNTSSTSFDLIQVFDTTNNTIETLATTLPNKFRQMSTCVRDNCIYVMGGYFQSSSNNDLYKFNYSSNTLTLEKASFTNEGRNLVYSFVYDEKIYYVDNDNGEVRKYREEPIQLDHNVLLLKLSYNQYGAFAITLYKDEVNEFVVPVVSTLNRYIGNASNQAEDVELYRYYNNQWQQF